MRMKLLATCLAAAALSPIASAQQTCEQQQNQRVAGTLAGGGIGAVVGGSVAGRGAKTEGAILGAIVGGVIGNQVAKPRQDCAHAYGFYDSNGAWHANNVARNDAQGFYGARGEWVEGAPRGRYNDQRQWENVDAQGYYDSNGHWVPPGVQGYYGPDNRWVGVNASVNANAGQPRYDDRNRSDDRSRYDDRGDSRDVVGRIDRLRDRINMSEDNRDLKRREARSLRDRLQQIAYRQARLPHRDGYLYPRDEADVQRQLDAVNDDFRRLSRR